MEPVTEQKNWLDMFFLSNSGHYTVKGDSSVELSTVMLILYKCVTSYLLHHHDLKVLEFYLCGVLII